MTLEPDGLIRADGGEERRCRPWRCGLMMFCVLMLVAVMALATIMNGTLNKRVKELENEMLGERGLRILAENDREHWRSVAADLHTSYALTVAQTEKGGPQ